MIYTMFTDKYIQLYTGRFPTIPNILSSAAVEETKYQFTYVTEIPQLIDFEMNADVLLAIEIVHGKF